MNHSETAPRAIAVPAGAFCVYFVKINDFLGKSHVKITGSTKGHESVLADIAAETAAVPTIAEAIQNTGPRTVSVLRELFAEFKVTNEWFRCEGALKDRLDTWTAVAAAEDISDADTDTLLRTLIKEVRQIDGKIIGVEAAFDALTRRHPTEDDARTAPEMELNQAWYQAVIAGIQSHGGFAGSVPIAYFAKYIVLRDHTPLRLDDGSRRYGREVMKQFGVIARALGWRKRQFDLNEGAGKPKTRTLWGDDVMLGLFKNMTPDERRDYIHRLWAGWTEIG